MPLIRLLPTTLACPLLTALLCVTLFACTAAAQSDTSPKPGDRPVTDAKTPDARSIAHPMLLCRADQFPELRKRAEHQPWRTMKAKALRIAANPIPTDRAQQLQRHLGALALAFILDEGNEKTQADRIHKAITEGLAAIEFNPARKWDGTVPPMGAAFTSILALDVAYNALTPEQLADCEAVIEKQISKIDRTGAWLAARLGTHNTWEIYHGRRTEPDDVFYDRYLSQMTPDGVSSVSPGYAFARLGSEDGRPQKTAYADVLEFTGIDNRYYNHPKLANFYRWLFSASVTPARQYHLFGDVGPHWKASSSALQYRVGRFDKQAAAYAAWYLNGQTPPGHLLSYVLMTGPLPEPIVPQSQLFMHGGAVFRETPDSPDSLGAALYNITEGAEWHTHQEVNAISLAGYGTRFTVNGGWLGPSTRPPTMNNTLAINGQDHQKMTGAGLREGLLSDHFDYAAGDSSDALGDSHFFRSLVLVHSQDNVGGYFVTFDEVNANEGDNIHSYLQLASESQATERTPGRVYEATIDHHSPVEGARLTVLYATQPRTIKHAEVESGKLSRTPAVGYHYRLEAIYPADAKGQRRIATVYFPHDADHPKADLAPITDDHQTGAIIRLAANTTDHIAESTGDRPITTANIIWQAKALVARHIDDALAFYFVRHGTQCLHQSVGFTSDQPISLHMRQTRGQITTAKPATITFHHPGLTAVQLDGQPIDAIERGDGWIKVAIPAGRHNIALTR